MCQPNRLSALVFPLTHLCNPAPEITVVLQPPFAKPSLRCFPQKSSTKPPFSIGQLILRLRPSIPRPGNFPDSRNGRRQGQEYRRKRQWRKGLGWEVSEVALSKGWITSERTLFSAGDSTVLRWLSRAQRVADGHINKVNNVRYASARAKTTSQDVETF